MSEHDPIEATLDANARLRAQNLYLRKELGARHPVDEIVGQTGAFLKVLDNIRRVAPTEATVLISGETGTGKELIASAVHAGSRRGGRPLIRVDCTLRPVSQLEAELFGRASDPADGATASIGRIELAHLGTLFLDEVAELPLELQARLLQVMQTQSFERPGTRAHVSVDVRIIAATNRDLRKSMRDGGFREDFFYRLNVFPVEMPPLRARTEDIPLLAQHFARKYAPRVGRHIDGIDPDTLITLSRYPWPGNVRELEHLVERALVLNNAPVLKIPPEMLAVDTRTQHAEAAAAATGMHRVPKFPVPAPDTLIDETENTGLHHVQREHILRVLNATHWVIEGNGGAALKLGMKPATLRHRMKKLGIARVSQAPASGIDTPSSR